MAETLYLAHDNSIDLILKADGSAIGTSSLTMITLTFGTVLVKSTDSTAGPIRWNQAGYDAGEIRIIGSMVTATADKYQVPVVVYDPTNTNGVVWGNSVEIDVLARVDATGAT